MTPARSLSKEGAWKEKKTERLSTRQFNSDAILKQGLYKYGV